MIVSPTASARSSGLPLDGELVLQTGGVVVLVSFLAVALLWREPRFAAAAAPARAPAPDPPGPGPAPGPRESATSSARVGTFDSASARFGQAAMLLLATAVVVFGLLGPQDPDEANPAPRALYVLFWVGVVPASLLLGPVWRVVNPLRLLHRLLAPLRRRPPGTAARSGIRARRRRARRLRLARARRSRPRRPRRGGRRSCSLYAAIAHGGGAAVRRGLVRPGRRVRGLLDASPARWPRSAGWTAARGCATRCAASRRSRSRARARRVPGRVVGLDRVRRAERLARLGGGPRRAAGAGRRRRHAGARRPGRRGGSALPARHRPARRGAGQHARPDRRRLHDRALR